MGIHFALPTTTGCGFRLGVLGQGRRRGYISTCDQCEGQYQGGEERSPTKPLKEGGHLLGIPVVDHIIIGENGYFSPAEAGLL